MVEKRVEKMKRRCDGSEQSRYCRQDLLTRVLLFRRDDRRHAEKGLRREKIVDSLLSKCDSGEWTRSDEAEKRQ
jgi:hypothetical protein